MEFHFSELPWSVRSGGNQVASAGGKSVEDPMVVDSTTMTEGETTFDMTVPHVSFDSQREVAAGGAESA